jgi:hypothetical protein
MPDANDSDQFLVGIPRDTREKYLPEGIDGLSELWVDLLKITVALGSVLSSHYKTTPIRLPRAEVEKSEREIRRCYQQRPLNNLSRIAVLHLYQLELYME